MILLPGGRRKIHERNVPWLGMEAIREALATLPDLMLLDLKVPRVHGFPACEILKADPRARRKPIIMLTPQRDGAEAIVAAGAGAGDYVPEPPDAEVLKTRVRIALRERMVHGSWPGAHGSPPSEVA